MKQKLCLKCGKPLTKGEKKLHEKCALIMVYEYK